MPPRSNSKMPVSGENFVWKFFPEIFYCMKSFVFDLRESPFMTTVMKSLCCRLFRHKDDFINAKNRPPTTQTCHQHKPSSSSHYHRCCRFIA